jgi:hypothetical protein
VAPNVWSYAFRPAMLHCTFPYLHAITDMGVRALPGWLRWPGGYVIYEPVLGCVFALPWAWLAPVTAAVGVQRVRALARASGGSAPPDAARTWLTVATILAAVGSFLVPLSVFWATMRFLGDMAPALTLAGTVGWWLWVERVRERPAPRRLIAAAAVALALVTVGIGAALGFEGQYQHFRQHNPALLERLAKAMSRC